MKRWLAILLLALTLPAGSAGIWINDAGVLREITGVWINDAGVLREITGVWINDAGTLRKIYSSGTVTVSGETISHTSLGTATAGIRFNTDGTVDKLTGSTYTQIDVATDWIIPNGAAPDDYEVRLESNSGDAFDAGAAVGVWVAFSIAREWKQIRSTDGTDTNTAVFGIRKGGAGGALDTGSFVFTAFNDV